MFTGLIETVGKLSAVSSRGNYVVLTVASEIPSAEIEIGESIACDGACLTVVSKTDDQFTVEASQETAEHTILGTYKVGAKLNLERALRVGSRLGGHFVSGHIDCAGSVDYLKPIGESLELAIKHDAEYDQLVIEKGSIAINGVSLTVNKCRSGWFSVNLIPHTAGETTLNAVRSGTAINLEFDLIGKYVSKMKQAGSKTGVTVDSIIESGW